MGEDVGVREFLVDVDSDYAYSKFHHGQAQTYDGDKTKKAVLKLAADLNLDPDTIHSIASTIEDEFGDLGDKEDFCRFVSDYDDFLTVELPDLQECYSTSPNAQCMAFCERCLPRLQEVLRKELAKEKGL
jgi:hypothetical protein